MKVYNPYAVAFIATIGGVMFGFDVSSMSGVISQQPYLLYFNSPNSLTQGGITASMAGGSMLGSAFSGWISDYVGRKYTIQLSSVIWIVGAIIQTTSINVAQLIAGRVVAGVAIGLASTQVPVYVAELAPAKIRGRLVGLNQWSVTWGILIMFLIAYGCAQIDSNTSFRLLWGLQIVPGVILFAAVFLLPESPRWLANRDRWEEAIETIANIQGKGDLQDPQVLIEIEEIKEQVRIDREAESVAIIDLFRKDSLKRTVTGICGMMWQQMCGMNVMMYYIVYIFEMAGFKGNEALVPSLIQYILNVIMTVPALLWIDRWGRRWTLMGGAFFLMIWLWAVAGLLAVYSHPVDEVNGNKNIRILIDKDHSGASKGVIACSYLFVCTFAPSWGPGMWVYCSEIFPMHQRAIANGITGFSLWSFNFALALFVPSAFANITWKTYLIFATFCFAMMVHVFLFFPETKGKTLEEITQIWEADIPAWRTASFEAIKPSLKDIKAAGVGEEKDSEV